MTLTRRRKKLLFGFGLFFLSIAAFLSFEHFRGSWALKRWKARMAAKGEEFSIDKLTPLLPTADENGLPQLLWVAGQLGGLAYELQPPAARDAVPGKRLVATRINEWQFRNSRRTNVTWVELAENLAVSEQRIEAALEALQSTAFNANLSYRGGLSLPMNHLQRIRNLAQFLSAAVLHDLHQQQNDAAFRRLQGLLALPNVLADERMVISQLVRFGAAQIAFSTTWQAMQNDGWSDAQLAALQDSWAAYDFLRATENAFAMERAMFVVEYERFRTSDLPLAVLFNPAGGVALTPTPSLLSWAWVEQMFDPAERLFAPTWRFAWAQQDELHYCQTVQSVLELYRSGIGSKAGVPVIAGIERIGTRRWRAYDRMRFLAAPLLLGAHEGAARRAWIAQTSAEIAKTAIAIKRYELREGKLPYSLEALVPEFLPDVPIDYMDGKALRYCVDSEDTFVLYSIGVDGEDAHGDGTYTTNNRATRDIIWPQPASDFESMLWSLYAFVGSMSRRGVPVSGN